LGKHSYNTHTHRVTDPTTTHIHTHMPLRASHTSRPQHTHTHTSARALAGEKKKKKWWRTEEEEQQKEQKGGANCPTKLDKIGIRLHYLHEKRKQRQQQQQRKKKQQPHTCCHLWVRLPAMSFSICHLLHSNWLISIASLHSEPETKLTSHFVQTLDVKILF